MVVEGEVYTVFIGKLDTIEFQPILSTSKDNCCNETNVDLIISEGITICSEKIAGNLI